METGTSGGQDDKFYLGHVARHPKQMSNMELKSKAWVSVKILGLNHVPRMVITYMEVDGLPPKDVNEMNTEEIIQEGREKQVYQRQS